MTHSAEPFPRPAPPSMARRLLRTLAPQRGRAALLATLLLGAIALQVAVPQLLRRFIDGARAGVPVATLVHVALLFLAAALLYQLLGAGATYVGASVGWTATNLLRRDLAEHTLALDLGFHNARTAGEVIERLDGDVTALSDLFAQFVVRVVGGALLLAGILAVLWATNAWMGAALTAFMALEGWALARTRRAGVPATRLEREANARLFGVIEEHLAGLDDLRANGAGAYAMHRFGEVMRTVFRDTRRAWVLRSLVWLSSYGLFVLGIGVTLAAAVVLVRRGALTVGGGYMVFQYMLMLQTPLEQITQQLQEVQKAVAGVGRIEELFARRSALPPGGERVLPPGPLALELRDVTFRYPEAGLDRSTLSSVSLTLPAGRRLGLLGRTGSGKSSLTRLLFRFYDATSGSVRVGGEDVRDVRLDALRARIGLVTQEVQLFRGSLRDNLTVFDESVDDARVLDVLDALGLSAWLADLPGGLDAVLESGGRNLSAGEAQLIAFARVFLQDPGVVILDEPSSRLDPITERRLERALERLLRGRTAVIIAHRLETVERVDDILVLDGGRVLETGPRAALAADPASHYARLRRAARGLDLDLGGGATPGRDLLGACR